MTVAAEEQLYRSVRILKANAVTVWRGSVIGSESTTSAGRVRLAGAAHARLAIATVGMSKKSARLSGPDIGEGHDG